jgi:hypothetical protein
MRRNWIYYLAIFILATAVYSLPAKADDSSALMNILSDVAHRYIRNLTDGSNYSTGSGSPSGNGYSNGSGYPSGNDYSNGSGYPSVNNYPDENNYSNRSTYPGGSNYSDGSPGYQPARSSSSSDSNGSVNGDRFVVALSGRDLAVLEAHEVAVLVDKSGSMDTRDCPPSPSAQRLLTMLFNSAGPGLGGLESRWEWCREQALSFSNQAARALGNGITLVPFSSDWKLYQHCNIDNIARVFAQNQPGGSTNLGPALRAIFQDYFQRRSDGSPMKPLVVAVITDGAPSSTGSVRSAIIDATKQMQNPDEITVLFLQVGHDRDGVQFLQNIDGGLLDRGALYKIVQVESFEHLQQVGLGRALAQAASAPAALR